MYSQFCIHGFRSSLFLIFFVSTLLYALIIRVDDQHQNTTFHLDAIKQDVGQF